MPNKLKECTISYYLVHWNKEARVTISLEDALKECLKLFPNTIDTQLPLKDEKAEIRHRKVTDNRLKLYIAKWTDKERAPIVPHNIKGPNNPLESSPPGDDWDYSDGDGAVLIAGNHYFVTPNRIHLSVVARYIRNLLRKGCEEGLDISSVDSFNLSCVANAKITQQIHEEGIKKIALEMGQYMETVHQQEKHSKKTIMQELRTGLLDILVTNDKTRQEIEDAENVRAQLIVSIDSRKPGLRAETLAPIAENIMQDCGNEDINIVTGKNNVFRRGELVLKKKTMIKINDKSLACNEAWEEMENYFSELQAMGVLEK